MVAITIKSSDMFKEFNCWARSANYQHKFNMGSFGHIMKEFGKHKNNGFSWFKRSEGRKIEIKAVELMQFLKSRDEFDEHAGDVAPWESII